MTQLESSLFDEVADVVRGMTDGLTQIAGIIRDANR